MNEIQTVKMRGQLYLLNGIMLVPKEDGNIEYELIKKWLSKGNTPEPEFTEKELYEQKKVNTITMRQARLYLYSVDKIEDVETMVQTRKDWQIEWEYTSEVERSSLLISKIKDKLGLTDTEVDSIFIEANKL